MVLLLLAFARISVFIAFEGTLAHFSKPRYLCDNHCLLRASIQLLSAEHNNISIMSRIARKRAKTFPCSLLDSKFQCWDIFSRVIFVDSVILFVFGFASARSARILSLWLTIFSLRLFLLLLICLHFNPRSATLGIRAYYRLTYRASGSGWRNDSWRLRHTSYHRGYCASCDIPSRG